MAHRLLNERVLVAFEDVMPGYGTVGNISRAFRAEGFEPGPPVDFGGERRSAFREHTEVIDWTRPASVRSALNVFETFVAWLGDYDPQLRAAIERALAKDGYQVTADGEISLLVGAAIDLPLAELRDASTIIEHLARLPSAVENDPPLAISQAKALLKATCKHILEELSVPYAKTDSVPQLCKAAQKALAVHPESTAPTAPGRDAIVKVLAGLGQIAAGLAELRNEYGPDHGSTVPTTGLSPRHGALAVGASQTMCRFLLETLARRREVPGVQVGENS